MKTNHEIDYKIILLTQLKVTHLRGDGELADKV